MNSKAHLTLSGLNLIVSYKAVINTGLSSKLKEVFPNINPIVKPAFIPSD